MLVKEQNDLLTQTGPGTQTGQFFRALLDPGAAGRRASRARWPAGAREASLGAAGRVPRHAGALRLDRGVLRPSPCVAVVRPQRGERAPLPLSRLEVRRDGPVRRDPVGARRQHALPAHPHGELSAGRARRDPVDLYGSARPPAAAARMGIRDGAGTQPFIPSDGRNATGSRRWRAASIRATSRSCTAAISRPIRCSRAQGQRVQHRRPDAVFDVVDSPGGLLSARAAMPRTASITGASRHG